MPSFVYGEKAPWPTQLEYAIDRRPTFTLVELGYYDVLEAAVHGDPGLLPEVVSFRSVYAQILSPLQDLGSSVLVMTVPDPLDTAHFSTLEAAANVLKVEPDFLLDAYGSKAGDLITVNGLNEIGYQLFGGEIGRLPGNATLSGEVASRVSGCVRALNAEIASLAREKDALVYERLGPWI